MGRGQNMKRKLVALLGAALVIAVSVVVVASARAGSSKKVFTTEFNIQACTFSSTGRNPYFVLDPGFQLILKGIEDGEESELHITSLPMEQLITLTGGQRIMTRVIEEREWANGELQEVSRNYFAICEETNSVFYFGEDVDNYEDGQIVNHNGGWRAGVNGAMPGMVMPGTFLLGSRYYQEIAPGVALDRAENVKMGLTVDVPAGHFTDVIRIKETSGLESGAEYKLYAPGVGILVDETLMLEEVIDPDN